VKKIILVIGVVSLGLSAQLLAAPSTTVAFDKDTRALLRNASPERGEAIAKKSKCAKCHGDNGVAEDAEDPTVAGQLATYSYKQLMDYKNGHRSDRSMKKAVKKLDAEMMADLAVWFQSLPTPEPAKKHSDVGYKLAYKGDPKRMIKPCATCHGRKGEGGMHDSAKLTGQGRDYFIATMQAFQEEDRTNDVYSRMRLIAMELTEEEIEALADYYAAVPPVEE